MSERRLGVIVSKESREEALIWDRDYGKLRLFASETLRPPSKGRGLSPAYRLGAWLRYRVRLGEAGEGVAAEVEAWEQSSETAIHPRLRFDVFSGSGWAVKDALGYVLNVNEREVTVWSSELGLITSKGARLKPPAHTWIRLDAEFRHAYVSDDYQSHWEMTQCCEESRQHSFSLGTPLERCTATQKDSGTPTAFVLDSDGTLLELKRHVFHIFHERPGQFLQALNDAGKKEADGLLTLSLILLRLPSQKPRILYAVPRHLLRQRLLDDGMRPRLRRVASTNDIFQAKATGIFSKNLPPRPKRDKPSEHELFLQSRDFASLYKQQASSSSSSSNAARPNQCQAPPPPPSSRRPQGSQSRINGQPQKPPLLPPTSKEAKRTSLSPPQHQHVAPPLAAMPIVLRRSRPASLHATAGDEQPREDDGEMWTRRRNGSRTLPTHSALNTSEPSICMPFPDQRNQLVSATNHSEDGDGVFASLMATKEAKLLKAFSANPEWLEHIQSCHPQLMERLERVFAEARACDAADAS